LGESGLNPAGGNTLILDKAVNNRLKLTELSTLNLTARRVFQWDSPKDGSTLCATLSLMSWKNREDYAPNTSLILPNNREEEHLSAPHYSNINREEEHLSAPHLPNNREEEHLSAPHSHINMSPMGGIPRV